MIHHVSNDSSRQMMIHHVSNDSSRQMMIHHVSNDDAHVLNDYDAHVLNDLRLKWWFIAFQEIVSHPQFHRIQFHRICNPMIPVPPDLRFGEYVKPYITMNMPVGGSIISSRRALPYVLKFQRETWWITSLRGGPKKYITVEFQIHCSGIRITLQWNQK